MKEKIENIYKIGFGVLFSVASYLIVSKLNGLDTRMDKMENKIDELMQYKLVLQNLAGTIPFKKTSYTLPQIDATLPEKEYEVKDVKEEVVL